MRYATLVWSADAVFDEDGNVSEGDLIATVSFYPETGNLYETTDGTDNEFAYRDREGTDLAEYNERIQHYADRGYATVAQSLW